MTRSGRRIVLGVTDRALLGMTVILTAIGVAMIHSAGQVDISSAVTGAWRRQAVWVVLSLVAFLLVVRVPLRWLEWVCPWLYGLSLLLLVVVLIVGTGPNTRSWIRLGPLSLQPAELAKLSTILMLARHLGSRREPETRLFGLWGPLGIVAAPFLLVLAQPDLGSALIFAVILVSALLWAGVPMFTVFMLISPGVSLILGFSATVWGIWFILVVALLYLRRPYVLEGVMVGLANLAAGALATPLWNRLAPYQQKRLLVFLDPEIDPRGAGWHLLQSKVAIGSGGWLGQGFGEGPQKRLSFLPEQHTDFIFSVVGEELGLIGVVVLLGMYVWLLSRVLRIAADAPSDFGSIAVFCLFSVWFAHLAINVGMTVGLMPITGLPLPFLSYGGSFLLTALIGLGVIQRVALER